MVGVALVTGDQHHLHLGHRQPQTRRSTRACQADLIVVGDQTGRPATFDPNVLAQTRELDDVSRVAGSGSTRPGHGHGTHDGPTPPTIASDAVHERIAASDSGASGTLDAGQIVVDDRLAKDQDLTIGATVTVWG